jgi:hypothetical protein
MKPTKQYALLYVGEGKRSAADVKYIRELPGVRVINDKEPRMMIIEGPRGTLTAVRKLPDWVASEQQAVFHVDPPSPFLANNKGRKA